MTTGDIQAHRLEIYGTEISRETISKIADHRQPRMTITARDTEHRTVPTAEVAAWRMPTIATTRSPGSAERSPEPRRVQTVSAQHPRRGLRAGLRFVTAERRRVAPLTKGDWSWLKHRRVVGAGQVGSSSLGSS